MLSVSDKPSMLSVSDKPSMLSVSDKPNMLSVIMLSVVVTQSVQFSLSGGLYHKTYYGRNLRISVLS